MATSKPRGLALMALLAVGAIVLAACGTSASPAPSAAASQEPASQEPASQAPGSSDGGGITMQLWVRTGDDKMQKAIEDQWNASHSNKIEITVIPSDTYVARVAAAASGGELPDLLGVDLIYMPDFIEQGLLQPITDKVNAYPKKADLSPGHLAVSTTNDGQIYGVPFTVDASSLFWNKDLYKRAGLDPEKGPTSWAEVADHAKKIRALGGDIYGFYFAGACPGCNAYTYLPQLWAAGGDVIDYTNYKATMTSDPVVKEFYQYYADLWKAGVIPESAKAENGATWQSTFASGKIGIQPLGGGWGIRGIAEQNPSLNFGVTYLPGKSSGQTASFAGGDTIAVTKSAKDVNAAWEFIEWTLSDEVQIEIYAKNGAFTSRTDLASNKYSDADPRYVLNNEALKNGRVPRTLGYNEIFNDLNGPWLASITQAVFGGDVDGALSTAQDAIQAILDSHYK